MRVLAFDENRFIEQEIEVGLVQALRHEYGVVWIDLIGLEDPAPIRHIGDLFGLHPLALEDVFRGGQPSKIELYEDHLFVVVQVPSGARDVAPHQINIFIGQGFVVTFQSRRAGYFEPVRERLRAGKTQIRKRHADYLAYALIDAAVDHMHPIIDRYCDDVDTLEASMSRRTMPKILPRLLDIRHELGSVKRQIDRLESAIRALVGVETETISEHTRTYLRDCHDHTLQLQDSAEEWRAQAERLLELHLALSGYELNEVMKVLTIISTVFIPLSFVTGLYGMNFNAERSPWNMPELNWMYGYPVVLAVMAVMIVAQLIFFRYKGWLGGARTSSFG